MMRFIHEHPMWSACPCAKFLQLAKELKKNIFWISLNIFIAFSYLFDIGLEVQYGVFIHAFMLLWWYKWLQLKE